MQLKLHEEQVLLNANLARVCAILFVSLGIFMQLYMISVGVVVDELSY
jgi:hypothetical protein